MVGNYKSCIYEASKFREAPENLPERRSSFSRDEYFVKKNMKTRLIPFNAIIFS